MKMFFKYIWYLLAEWFAYVFVDISNMFKKKKKIEDEFNYEEWGNTFKD